MDTQSSARPHSRARITRSYKTPRTLLPVAPGLLAGRDGHLIGLAVGNAQVAPGLTAGRLNFNVRSTRCRGTLVAPASQPGEDELKFCARTFACIFVAPGLTAGRGLNFARQ